MHEWISEWTNGTEFIGPCRRCRGSKNDILGSKKKLTKIFALVSFLKKICHENLPKGATKIENMSKKDMFKDGQN